MSLSLSHLYSGSGLVLDCIDSGSLPPYLLSPRCLVTIWFWGMFFVTLLLYNLVAALYTLLSESVVIYFGSNFTSKTQFLVHSFSFHSLLYWTCQSTATRHNIALPVLMFRTKFVDIFRQMVRHICEMEELEIRAVFKYFCKKRMPPIAFRDEFIGTVVTEC